MKLRGLFAAESVSAGHSDKLADQIADAVLDYVISQDSNCRLACECLLKSNLVVLAGEITADASLAKLEDLVRKVIIDVGYDNCEMGFNGSSCTILQVFNKQSTDIGRGVNGWSNSKINQVIGAGDQGVVYGYACNETSSFMPLAVTLAHQLMQKQATSRKEKLSFLGPDAKTQVLIDYLNGKPLKIKQIIFSTQHSQDIELAELQKIIKNEIIEAVIPHNLLTKDTEFLINPTGRFVTGGPAGDCGLTGRKIIVDSYGGFAHHGGGAFSGKDPSKIDRSAAYMARYLAKNIVAAGLAERCELQLSYAIGVPRPCSLNINSFGTGVFDDSKLEQIIWHNFDLSVQGIINTLELLQPIYLKTATYGHFGRETEFFNWEKLTAVKTLQNIAKSA